MIWVIFIFDKICKQMSVFSETIKNKRILLILCPEKSNNSINLQCGGVKK